MISSGSEVAVELRGITKQFGSVLANAGVDLRVEPGTIQGLIGENGAGKSTAMKILYGLYRPDSGHILIRGQPQVWSSPRDAIAQGIGMVHQHFMLAGPYSALDNIILGAEGEGRGGRERRGSRVEGRGQPSGAMRREGAPDPRPPTLVRAWGILGRKHARERLEALAAQYRLSVDWEAPIEQLPVGIQQRVEILKLLYHRADVLILDEPTAVLTPQETNDLFANLKKLRDEGKTIIFVTHKLKEVMAFTDRVTVFRGGSVVGEALTSQTSPQELADLMVGRKVVLNVQAPPTQATGKAALEVEALVVSGTRGATHRVSNVTFSVRSGEIVGIAGVEGNGQSELLQALLHPREPQCRKAGRISITGMDVTQMTAREIRNLGVSLIPEDRLHEGLLPEWPLRDNFLLGLQHSAAFNRAGFICSSNLQAAAAKAVNEYDVRPANLALSAGNLSGGNQQKLIVAREFERRPKLLIAAQPTRGVDVGATEFIHRRIIKARDEGAGVLLVSSELEEIMALSDRILVMYEGRIAGEFAKGNFSESLLGLRMGGG
ncbi:MAG: heme ABC transporter ATP-binding protein [Verrucomicrobia bacterium]|nr:MAG: heme ABC transporter ATP-binding protein [Verrucomicrobiota bacterium]